MPRDGNPAGIPSNPVLESLDHSPNFFGFSAFPFWVRPPGFLGDSRLPKSVGGRKAKSVPFSRFPTPIFRKPKSIGLKLRSHFHLVDLCRSGILGEERVGAEMNPYKKRNGQTCVLVAKYPKNQILLSSTESKIPRKQPIFSRGAIFRRKYCQILSIGMNPITMNPITRADRGNRSPPRRPEPLFRGSAQRGAGRDRSRRLPDETCHFGRDVGPAGSFRGISGTMFPSRDGMEWIREFWERCVAGRGGHSRTAATVWRPGKRIAARGRCRKVKCQSERRRD